MWTKNDDDDTHREFFTGIFNRKSRKHYPLENVSRWSDHRDSPTDRSLQQESLEHANLKKIKQNFQVSGRIFYF
jgi:hypothetical protein